MTEFECATKIYCGSDALSVLKPFSSQRVLIVADRYFSQSGKAQEIGMQMNASEVQVFDEVSPDPTAALAAKGAAVCHSFRPQILIALGGGSAIDCAKGIKAAYGGEVKFIAIPTTSGSGSEVTSFSVLTCDSVKHPLIDPDLRPDAAILDASLLQTLPPAVVADCGMDLLAHCLEAAVSLGRNGFTDAFAHYGAGTVFSALRASMQGDRSVRQRIHEAAAMAGLSFQNAGLGICHSLAHAIGGSFPISHGRLCGILLPHVLDVNAGAAMTAYAELARACGLTGQTDRLAVRSLRQAVVSLRRELGMPDSIKAAGVQWAAWEEKMEAMVRTALRDPCCASNPIQPSAALLAGIVKEIYG